jgi:hypothetical protein
LHVVIILVNTHLTRIILPPWHNVGSVGVNPITLDAFLGAKLRIKTHSRKLFVILVMANDL